ncbi:hypothetical protein I302_101086 [Kwoniella bestiolae CBS 10118]|uniref:Uncharacterized protein n=1 Tax=Kwoniella bestiolae CBS 10118 TaxID=1296100 RepID=A0A1B9G6Z5_9TREE|nr:hypothetical protein I302_04462 [Kwoniella bestiolae CBS 10118]OCF26773.1 hypothetical protein I302_04462 [Kwoniella bestiolae CBS 10118]
MFRRPPRPGPRPRAPSPDPPIGKWWGDLRRYDSYIEQEGEYRPGSDSEADGYGTSPEERSDDSTGEDEVRRERGRESGGYHPQHDYGTVQKSQSTGNTGTSAAGEDLPPRYEEIYLDLDPTRTSRNTTEGSSSRIDPDPIPILTEITGGSSSTPIASSRSTTSKHSKSGPSSSSSKYTRSSTRSHAGTSKSEHNDIFAGMPSMSSTMTYGHPSYPHSGYRPYPDGSYVSNNPYFPQPRPHHGYQPYLSPPRRFHVPPQPQPQFQNMIRSYLIPSQLALQPTDGITYVPHRDERYTAKSTESHPYARSDRYSTLSQEDIQIDPQDIIVYPSSSTSTLPSFHTDTNGEIDTISSTSLNLNFDDILPPHPRDISNGRDEATRHRGRYEFSLSLSFSADDASEFADGLRRVRGGLEGIEGAMRGRR